jgi:hypothetical protein
LAGIEATAEQVEERVKEEEKQLEKIRIINRRVRDQVMKVEDMMDEGSPEDGASLVSFRHAERVRLSRDPWDSCGCTSVTSLLNAARYDVAAWRGRAMMPRYRMADEQKTHISHIKPHPRRLPTSADSAADAYAVPSTRSKDVEELKSHFKSMHLRANPRVTPERVYCMVVHPDPTRSLVCAGDKHGVVGMYVDYYAL